MQTSDPAWIDREFKETECPKTATYYSGQGWVFIGLKRKDIGNRSIDVYAFYRRKQTGKEGTESETG